MNEANQKKRINEYLADNLKLARSKQGWSLDACSVKTGVSKAMLGQIERGESSPTISKLWQIATGFKLPLSYFLTEQKKSAFESNSNLLNTQASISVVTLFGFDKATKMETFEITLNPNHEHISKPHNKGVVEHIIVIEGAMEYFLNDVWCVLNTGEILKFDGDQIHGYRNINEQACKFHNMICYI
jgi:transcriptional regulator with XRE-family HTH domain